MLKDMIIQILPQILFFVITVIVSFITVLLKNWYNANKGLIEAQKQQAIQTIGIDKYNQDVNLAKLFIHSIEEQARKFDWDSIIKHAKATELISNATGLSNDQIYNVIKATVDEWNVNKPKTVISDKVQSEVITGQVSNEIK